MKPIKPTKATRHKIYVKALELFNETHVDSTGMDSGMCWCIAHAAVMLDITHNYNVNIISNAESLPELYEFKPKINEPRYSLAYWFIIFGTESITLRREALEYCIKATERKSKTL